MKFKLLEELQFQYTCVNSGDKLEELEYIIDHSKQISYVTFIKNVDKEFINEFNENVGIPINKDWAVTFYKSKLPNGKPAYYFDHSAIEHVFY